MQKVSWFSMGVVLLFIALGWGLWLFRPELLMSIIQGGGLLFALLLIWKHINVQPGSIALLLDSSNRPWRVVFGGRHIVLPFLESVLTIGNTSDASVWNPCKKEITLQDQTVSGLPFKCDIRVDVIPFDVLELVRDELARDNPNFPYICSYSSPEYFLRAVSKQCAAQFVQMGLEEFASSYKDRMEEDRDLVKSQLTRKFMGIQGSWVPNGELKLKPTYKPYWKWLKVAEFSVTHLEWDARRVVQRSSSSSSSSKEEAILKLHEDLIRKMGGEVSVEQRIHLLRTATEIISSSS